MADGIKSHDEGYLILCILISYFSSLCSDGRYVPMGVMFWTAFYVFDILSHVFAIDSCSRSGACCVLRLARLQCY